MLAAAFAAALALQALADAPAARTAIVHFADGSSVPLRNWTLSYEYLTWNKGESPARGQSARREGMDLWIGRRALPLAGAVLTIAYGETRRETLVDGRPQPILSSTAREVTVAAGGDSVKVKVEPPDRLFLAGGAPKSVNLIARSVDLRGEGITGTRREVCLLSYSTLVDCGSSPADQVVKVELR
jgi:hypothetical protein